MNIFQQTQRRVFFLFGILATGLIGIVSDYLHTNYSKDDSLILPTAHADYFDYTGTGDGCGGCSGDSSF